MILQARTEANDILIAMYETEEPRRNKFENGPIGNLQYLEALKQWQSSKREYKVRDEKKKTVKELIWKSYRKSLGGGFDLDDYKKFDSLMEKGIDCTFLKDRLKVEYGCVECEEIDSCKNGCEGTYSVGYWTLLPLEQLKPKEVEQTNEAEFTDWLKKEEWEYIQGLDQWRNKKGIVIIKAPTSPLYQTTAELYQLFKNPNKQ